MTTYRQAKWFIIYVITQGELVDEKAYQTTEMFLDQRKEFLRFFCISLNTKIVSFNAMCDAAIRIAFFFFEYRRKGLCGGLLSITLNVSKVRETGMISAEKYPAAPYNFFFSVWINLTSNFVFRWPDILSFRAKKF